MKQFLMMFLTVITLSAPAFALDLMGAKDQGLVGETTEGFIAAVKDSSAVNELVMATNKGRMAVYKQTAAEQGVSPSEVQALAAQKLFNMAAKGHYLKTSSGWVKK